MPSSRVQGRSKQSGRPHSQEKKWRRLGGRAKSRPALYLNTYLYACTAFGRWLTGLRSREVNCAIGLLQSRLGDRRGGIGFAGQMDESPLASLHWQPMRAAHAGPFSPKSLARRVHAAAPRSRAVYSLRERGAVVSPRRERHRAHHVEGPRVRRRRQFANAAGRGRCAVSALPGCEPPCRARVRWRGRNLRIPHS